MEKIIENTRKLIKICKNGIQVLAHFCLNFTKKHWVWYTIFLSMPTIWFTLCDSMLGTMIGIKDAGGNGTTFGITISVIVIIITFSIALLNNREIGRLEDSEISNLQGNVDYLNVISESVDVICTEKLVKLENSIIGIKSGKIKPVKIVTKPNTQLLKIAEKIAFCLSEIMSEVGQKVSSNDFYVTIAYNFPQEEDKWDWVKGTHVHDMSINTLTGSRKKTTFNHLKTTGKLCYFNNYKENASEEGNYLYNAEDINNVHLGKPAGSIFCQRFRFSHNNKCFIDAMVSISTQGIRFVEDESKTENAQNNLIKLVKEAFGTRINIELALLYLEHLYNAKE